MGVFKLDKSIVNLLKDEISRLHSEIVEAGSQKRFDKDPTMDLIKREEFLKTLEERVGIVAQRMGLQELLDVLREKYGEGDVMSLMWSEQCLLHVLSHAEFRPESLPNGFLEEVMGILNLDPDDLVCPFCGSRRVHAIVVNPSKFREERRNPEAYVCSDCNRLLGADML